MLAAAAVEVVVLVMVMVVVMAGRTAGASGWVPTESIALVESRLWAVVRRCEGSNFGGGRARTGIRAKRAEKCVMID